MSRLLLFFPPPPSSSSSSSPLPYLWRLFFLAHVRIDPEYKQATAAFVFYVYLCALRA